MDIVVEYALEINQEYVADCDIKINVKTEEGITGRLYPEDIEGDKFNYNDNYLTFSGKKTKKRIKIGTRLVLTALEADRDFGSISFGVQQDDLALIKSRKRGA